MLSLLVLSVTGCTRLHASTGQWAIAIFQWLSAPIFTIGDVLSLNIRLLELASKRFKLTERQAKHAAYFVDVYSNYQAIFITFSANLLQNRRQ